MIFMSQINGIKELLFAIFLMLLALWSWFLGSEAEGVGIFLYLTLMSPIVGIIYAIIGLSKKDK